MEKFFMSRAEQRRAEMLKERNRKHFSKRDWDDDEIRMEFDSNPNLTIAELAIRCGKTASEVKRILMEG